MSALIIPFPKDRIVRTPPRLLEEQQALEMRMILDGILKHSQPAEPATPKRRRKPKPE